MLAGISWSTVKPASLVCDSCREDVRRIHFIRPCVAAPMAANSEQMPRHLHGDEAPERDKYRAEHSDLRSPIGQLPVINKQHPAGQAPSVCHRHCHLPASTAISRDRVSPGRVVADHSDKRLTWMAYASAADEGASMVEPLDGGAPPGTAPAASSAVQQPGALPSVTALKALLRERHAQSYKSFKRLYQEAAAELNRALLDTCPAERTYYRWINGQVETLPYPDACGVLEAMFPGYSIEQLFAPWDTPNATPTSSDLAGLVEARSPAADAVPMALPPKRLDHLHAVDLGMAPADFLAGITPESPVPSRIGWSEVEHVRATTRAVAMAENLHGGGLSCEAGISQLRWAGRLLDVPASDDVRRAMFESVGNLGGVVAFSAFDIADYGSADRCFHFALWCADQSGSWRLRANTLAEMSRKAVYLGDLDEALSLIEFAQVRADRVSAAARAMMSALRARLLVLLDRSAEALAEIDRADEYFSNREAETEPPWLVYYDEAEHQGTTGRALIPLARAGRDPEMAISRLASAIDLQDASYVRSRTFTRTRLASLMMSFDEPQEAMPMAWQALNDAATLRSSRIVNELNSFARIADQHAQLDDVAELRQSIDALPVCQAGRVEA